MSCSGLKSRSIDVLGSGTAALAAPRPGIVVGRHRKGDSSLTGGADPVAHADAHVEPRPAAAGVVNLDSLHPAAELHGVAGEDGGLHPKLDPPEPALGPGPVLDVALEPGGVVWCGQEDVRQPIARRGELVFVMHRSTCARD